MTIAFPHPPGHGGPGSFQLRFEKALKEEGHQIAYAGETAHPDLVFVVGGTRKLLWLWRMKRAGIPILYRLDGINWLHRKTKVSFKNYFIAESRNLLNKIIHSYLADHIVYQSNFVKRWWEREGWKNNINHSIISNGVDLNTFSSSYEPSQPTVLMCLEGTIDYSPYAIELLNRLSARLRGKLPVVVYGGFQDPGNENKLSLDIDYRGKVAREDLSKTYKNAIYLSLDINAACPNTVIEALACGLPIVGYDTGALRELVPEHAGKIVDFGSNPWELGFPNVENLLNAILEVAEGWNNYSIGARKEAESNHSFNKIFKQYLILLETLEPAKSNNKPGK